MNATGHTFAPVMSERKVSLIGALFVAIGPVTLALYTPAMTQIIDALNTTQAMVNLTLTIYFGGFATAQLVAGPISDALGRKPVTFVFMGIFLLATLVALVAPTIEVLIAARFVQGIGASAGIAISRAIVRDLYRGDTSARIMNLIGIILAVGPAFAPTLGGAMLQLFGWRSIFFFMALMGVAVVLVTAFSLKETVVADRSRFNVASLISSYGQLLTNAHFMATTLTLAGAIGAVYTMMTFLPFILMGQVGLSPTEYGLGMLLQTGCFFLGSLVVRHLIGRYSAYSLVLPGLAFIFLGSIASMALFFMEPSYLRVILPIGIYSAGIAFVMPAMTTAALAPFPRIAGAAASLMGFVQMGTGLVMGTIGGFFANPTFAMATLVPVLGLLSCVSYIVYRRHPHLAEPEPRKDVIASLPVGRTQMPD